MVQMKFYQWRYSLFLLPFAWWLPAGSLQAAPNISCTAGMNTVAGSAGIVNISNAVTPENAENSSISNTLSYNCTNSGTAGYVSVCLAVDGGDYNSSVIFPRYMNTDTSNRKLAFTMTLPGGAIWGTRNSGVGSEYNSGSRFIPAVSSISGDVPIQVSLLPNNGNTLATAGTYNNNFNGNHTTLTFETNANDINAPNCSTGNPGITRFTFVVQATVVASCKINTTSNINLGRHPASATNILGSNSNAIAVTCTNSAPYYIGLAPSNGNVNGAGIMSGTGSNTDELPYQLRSKPGIAGTIWGNTTTSTAVGNGVEGIGNGSSQSKTVYVTVPSADFKADNYSDIVTIRVNY